MLCVWNPCGVCASFRNIRAIARRAAREYGEGMNKRHAEKLWHVVLLSFRSETPESVREDVYRRYQTLQEDCGGATAGILFFNVQKNLDLRKQVHLVEIAVFRDEAALQAFRAHPKHQELTNILRRAADWQVGDLRLRKVPADA